VNAIVRAPGHTYLGQSTSPPGTIPARTMPARPQPTTP